MVSAYIFIETDHGKARLVNDAIRKLPFVKRSHPVTGPYDLIAFVEVLDLAVLGEDVVTKIQSIPGVVKSLTNIVVD
ncbi:MAG: Lrp/AsnC ligand binding domain-containing protein [Chlamydiae bacterium]|nr:Lrp/AsnC ligand binding domain-containing protein [Chlamydiota bacterium]MBI3276530.1 Lrp/AsnC ligand binding domain-containing protein [Chlamydiota bacterium]